MKTKMYLIAVAIIGGMLFTAYTTNIISDGQQSAKIERKSRPILADVKIERKSRPILAEAKIERKSRPILAEAKIERKSRPILA